MTWMKISEQMYHKEVGVVTRAIFGGSDYVENVGWNSIRSLIKHLRDELPNK